MSGHLPCTATLSMSRHIATLNYLRSADTCLTRTRTVIYWLSVPVITDSVKKCRVFGGDFNPKSLAHLLTCDRLTLNINVMFNNYSIHDYDNARHCNQYECSWLLCSRAMDINYVWRPRPPIPLACGHLSCTDTFAWSGGCPFMTGTTVEQKCVG